MSIDLMVSQGRIAHRTAGAIRGAALTAQVLEQRYRTKPQYIGEPAAPVDDERREALLEANETLARLARAVSGSIQSGGVPLMVANTCSAGIASLPVVAREYPDAVVLWIDAHGDFITPETTSCGYLGGMALAAVCGLWDSGYGSGIDPGKVVIIGARDIDEAEGKSLRGSGVRIIPPNDVTPGAVLCAIGNSPVWIHLDWDAVEPGFVPAAYKVPAGMVPA